MTIKDLAEVAGISQETVRVKGKELFPERFINGVKTVFTKEQSVKIMSELRTKGSIIPTEKLAENKELVTRSDLATFGAAIVSEMMKQFMPLIQNRQPIMIEQDYFSVNGYANKMGHKLGFSEALIIGKSAGRLSREKGYEIRKVDDERWGQVNSYHVDILKEVFEV